jgi:hypothetical protein
MLWRKDQSHTEESLARFFRGQDVKLQLEGLINLGILEQELSGEYVLSQDQVIQDAIKRVNDRDRAARNLVDCVLSQLF